jgi:hypothetical protein
MQGAYAPAPVYTTAPREAGPVSEVLQDRRSHRHQRPQSLVSFRDHGVARGSYGCAAAAASSFESYAVKKIESPGAVAAHRASEKDGLGRHVLSNVNRQQQVSQPPIRATLIGSNRCEAEGIIEHGYAPVLDLCRALIKAGRDPKRALHAYRGEVLALAVRSIGEGARLTVADDRHGTPRLRRLQGRPQGCAAGSPVAQIADGWGEPSPRQPATGEAGS